jgi:hypothetical protein
MTNIFEEIKSKAWQIPEHTGVQNPNLQPDMLVKSNDSKNNSACMDAHLILRIFHFYATVDVLITEINCRFQEHENGNKI